jgi:hypothetical protein
MADKFRLKTRLPHNFQGSLTCRKSVTWDKRLYFPSEGRRAKGFFARKIRQLPPGLNPRSWVPEASTLTTRPPKPLTRMSWPWKTIQGVAGNQQLKIQKQLQKFVNVSHRLPYSHKLDERSTSGYGRNNFSVLHKDLGNRKYVKFAPHSFMD